MELQLIKTGNLMGTPDVKALQWAAGPGSGGAHDLWLGIERIKAAFGYDGGCTTALLRDDSRPEAFPALLDPSWILPVGGMSEEQAIEGALAALSAHGLEPDQIRSVLITHDHPDHFHPRLLQHLPKATAYTHPDMPISSCHAFDSKRFGPGLSALPTPGHWGPHTSFLFELARFDLAVCAAGDLIMNHAHFLDRKHPLSFRDPQQGLTSIDAVIEALSARGSRFKMILPGHGRPFFV